MVVEKKSVFADAEENFIEEIVVIFILIMIAKVYIYYVLNDLVLQNLNIIIKKVDSFCNGDSGVSFGKTKIVEID